MRRHNLPTFLLSTFLVLAIPQPSEAAGLPPPSAAEPTHRLSLGASVWTASPVALRTGLVFGGAAEVRRPLGTHGLFAGAQLAFGRTSEANRAWRLTHLQGLALATVGAEKRAGVGLLGLRLGFGGLAIRQNGERQQYERLLAAGIADVRRDAWSFGPWLSAELGVSVAFYDAWRATLQCGPAFTVQKVSGTRIDRWVLSSGVGVAREF